MRLWAGVGSGYWQLSVSLACLHPRRYKLHRRLELKTCAVEDVDEESAEYADTPANAFKIRSDHKYACGLLSFVPTRALTLIVTRIMGARSFIVCADTQQLKEEWLIYPI